MRIRIRLTDSSRQAVAARLHFAYQSGQLRLVKRIHALFAIVAGESVTEVAEQLYLGEQTVRDYVCAFIRHGVDSLSYERPRGGRPAHQDPTKGVGRLDYGRSRSGWLSFGLLDTPVICDLILTRFGVEYHPHYLCELLDELGFSFPKARFVSDHLDEAARQHWLTETWPEIRRVAQAQAGHDPVRRSGQLRPMGILRATLGHPKGSNPRSRPAVSVKATRSSA